MSPKTFFITAGTVGLSAGILFAAKTLFQHEERKLQRTHEEHLLEMKINVQHEERKEQRAHEKHLLKMKIDHQNEMMGGKLRTTELQMETEKEAEYRRELERELKAFIEQCTEEQIQSILAKMELSGKKK